MPTAPELRALVGAVGRHWKEGVSGSVLFAVVAFLDRLRTEPVFSVQQHALVLFGAYLLFALGTSWVEEHRRRLALESELVRHMSIEFVPDQAPYREKILNAFGTRRYFRIAVRNLGGATIHNVSLRLDYASEPDASGIHLEHKLQVSGVAFGIDSASIAPHERQFFDFICEQEAGVERQMVVCYANGADGMIDRTKAWRIGLRAEGEGPVVRQAFYISRAGNDETELRASPP